MRIATSTQVAFGVVLGLGVGIGVWLHSRRPPEPAVAALDVAPPALDLALEPSSSSVQHEPPAPVSQPFYASLFVAGATWDLPCTFTARLAEPRSQPSEVQRCRVESVEVRGRETRARIACWFVHEPEVTDPDPAVNTYVMTDDGLYMGDATGEPMFTPHPIPKPLPKRWGYDEPTGLEAMHADAIVRHHGAWCLISETQSMDTGGGTTDCISRRGIVGMTYHRDFMAQQCGDVP